MADREWIEFDGGSTIGQQGSQRGTIIRDDELQHSARITLERDTQIAPFAITCGVYGWMVHTRFFRSDADANRQYEEVRIALGDVCSTIPDAASIDDELQKGRVSFAIENFVKTYP